MQWHHLLWTARVKEGFSFPKEFWNQRDFEDKKHYVYGPKTQYLQSIHRKTQSHFIQCKQNFQCLLFFCFFFRDRYTRKFTMSHQDHHHSQNPDHLKTSFFLHPLAQLFPSLAFPCDTFFFFFLHYEARSYKELATSNVNIVINIVFGKWNLYFHGNFKNDGIFSCFSSPLLKPIQISPINRTTVSWNFSQLADKNLLNVLLLTHVALRRSIYLGQVYVYALELSHSDT